MQGRRPGEVYNSDPFFGVDPTQPAYSGSYSQAGVHHPGLGAPVGGSVGGQPHLPPQPGQNFFPPLAGYIDNRYLSGSGYSGFPSAPLKGRPASGLIGEVATPSSSAVRGVPSIGYGDRTQSHGQQVAKLRHVGSTGANGQGAPTGQLSLSSTNSLPYYGPRAVGQLPPIGQSGGGLPQGLLSFGSTSSFGGQPVGHRSSSGASLAGGGAPIGQLGSLSGFQSQQSLGAYASGQTGAVNPGVESLNSSLSSPFIPASTTGQPINAGPSHYSMSVHGEKSGSAEGTQRGNPSGSMSGGLSNMGSISNLGSISQMGSIGMANLPAAHTSRSHSSFPHKVKAVCSSGGHFVKLPGGGFEYQGGETRLIAIPNFCRFSELSEALERIAGNANASSSASSEQSPSIKYQLPSEPNVYVDLLDDEDTQLMFDEWHEYTTSAQKSATAKLHLFVDWHRRQPMSEASLNKGEPRNLQGSGESIEQPNSAGSAEERSNPNSAEMTGTPNSQPKYDYQDIADRMEVIQPKDVSLAKFLGSGGYGEVYLGKWHSSEAAIKCLNPSLFFTEGLVSQAAIKELIREADLLGSLRHPNVVWVYGIVLPKVRMSAVGDDSSEDASDDEIGSEPSQQSKPGVPGSVRPPAIVTEFMSQGSLKGALQRKADIVQGALMRVLIAMDAAKGMEYLHSKRIVHFDLKSANLLLGYRDRRAICKVADFGLSKQRRETYVSGVSSQRGTLPWIAPEIIKSPTTVNEKVDVYSFGVVLWELWTGKEPYDGLNYHALLHQINTSAAFVRPALPGSTDWDPDVGPEPAPGYRALMERCWTESPAGRPSFSDIVKVLKDMASALRPVRKARPPSSSAASSNASARLREVATPSKPPSQAEPPLASLFSVPATAPVPEPAAPQPAEQEEAPAPREGPKLGQDERAETPGEEKTEAAAAAAPPPTQPAISAFGAVQQTPDVSERQ